MLVQKKQNGVLLLESAPRLRLKKHKVFRIYHSFLEKKSHKYARRAFLHARNALKFKMGKIVMQTNLLLKKKFSKKPNSAKGSEEGTVHNRET